MTLLLTLLLVLWELPQAWAWELPQVQPPPLSTDLSGDVRVYIQGDCQPVQTKSYGGQGQVSSLVTLRAYEVYSSVFGPQDAIITGSCRGGFGAGELIAFLYARSFPEKEWRQRVDEALSGMKNV